MENIVKCYNNLYPCVKTFLSYLIEYEEQLTVKKKQYMVGWFIPLFLNRDFIAFNIGFVS